MKTLLTLSLLLASATSALAFSPEQVAKVMNQAEVKTALANQNIKNIADGPSYRCMGCYGLILQTDGSGDEVETYNVQVMDFAGRFHVSIGKIKN